MDLNKIRCKKCKYYRGLYISPVSKSLPKDLKGSRKGFTCVLPCDEEFIKSFGGEDPEPYVDIVIGSYDSAGCENFTEVESED